MNKIYEDIEKKINDLNNTDNMDDIIKGEIKGLEYTLLLLNKVNCINCKLNIGCFHIVNLRSNNIDIDYCSEFDEEKIR